MKEMIMKRFTALALAMLMLAMVPVGALAEGEDITTPTDLMPVITEEPAATENASNVTEEIVETVAEEPAEEIVVEETEQPTVEETEEPVVEPTAEPTVEPTAEPTAEPTTEPTVEPTAEPAPQGTVRIILLNEGPLYYGDEVALLADVDNVEDEHTLTWQIKVEEDKWENIAVGRTYRFILTPENANLEYRVIVSVAE